MAKYKKSAVDDIAYSFRWMAKDLIDFNDAEEAYKQIANIAEEFYNLLNLKGFSVLKEKWRLIVLPF